MPLDPTTPHDGDPSRTTDHPTGAAGAAAPPEIPGYDVVRVLGRGGMGVVYEAWHRELNRPAAIKLLLGGRYADPTAQARFQVEAEVVAGLAHPHVVQVYEYGRCADQPYFALEYVAGGSLADRLRAGPPFAPPEAAGLVAKLAAAMAAAHARGVVHRDLKPANILLTADGEPKVADFGLAKVALPGAAETAAGAVMGTPRYMAPEQAAGRTGEVGTPADVYALGAILYELLTGRPPFVGDAAPAVIHQVLTAEPPRPRALAPGTPRDLETVCLTCLEKEPARRYPTAAALADDLRRFAAGEPVSVRPAGRGERAVKWVRRNPTLAALYAASAGVAAVLAVAVAVGVLWRGAAAARDALDGQQKQTEEARRETAGALTQVTVEKGKLGEAFARLTDEKGKTDAARKDAEAARDALAAAQGRLGVVEYGRAVQLAFQTWLTGDAAGALAILDATRPDLRGWEWWYVRRQCHTFGLTLPPAPRPAVGPAPTRPAPWFDADGVTLWTGYDHRPGGTRVRTGFDVRTGAALARPAPPAPPPPPAAWYVGRLVAVGTAAGRRVYDTETWAEHAYLRGAERFLASADGRRVLRPDPADPKRVLVWEDGKQVFARDCSGGNPDRGVGLVAVSPDGAWAATTRFVPFNGPVPNGVVPPPPALEVWDTRTGRPVAAFPVARTVLNAQFNPNGTRLVAPGSHLGITIEGAAGGAWDVTTGVELSRFRGLDRSIASVAFSSDGKCLATGGHDGMLRVWDGTDFTLRTAVRVRVGGKIEFVTFSPDGARVATTDYLGGHRVWRLDDATGVADFDLGFRDARRAVRGAPRPPVRGPRRRRPRPPPRPAPRRDRVPRTGRVAGRAVGRSPARGGRGGRGARRENRGGAVRSRRGGFTAPVRNLAFAPDGQRLSTVCGDGTVRLWETRYGVEVLRLPAPLDQNPGQLAFSADGRLLGMHTSGFSLGERVRVWDAAPPELDPLPPPTAPPPRPVGG